MGVDGDLKGKGDTEMKRVLVVTALALLSVSGSMAVDDVVGSLHDLSSTGPNTVTNATRVCVFCHTPHVEGATLIEPLWNHTMSSQANYGVYTSNTMSAVTVTDIGGGTAVSNLCMSCHDGSIGVHSMVNAPNETTLTVAGGGNVAATTGFMTGTPEIGTDLTNDHPVNFDYSDAYDLDTTGLNATPAVAELFGDTVQCASCHNVHDNTIVPFMIASNVNSALCTDCHTK